MLKRFRRFKILNDIQIPLLVQMLWGFCWTEQIGWFANFVLANQPTVHSGGVSDQRGYLVSYWIQGCTNMFKYPVSLHLPCLVYETVCRVPLASPGLLSIPQSCDFLLAAGYSNM